MATLVKKNNKQKNKQRPPISDRIFMVFVYLFLIVSLVLVFFPLWYVLVASFSDPKAVISGQVWLWPVQPTLRGYRAVFQNNQIITGFMNSFIYMIAGTVISLVLTVMAAYPLSRKEFIGRNVIMMLFVFTMLFSGGLIPQYLLLKDLGMLNTRWAILIPSALSVWNLIIIRTFYVSTIPQELYDAAALDGCNDLQVLLRIVIPLSGPILAVIALYYGVGQWNSYFNAMVFLRKKELFPLQIALREILILSRSDGQMIQDVDALERMQGMAQLLRYSVIVVASLPLMIIYPFVQKHFVQGVMIGAIKG